MTSKRKRHSAEFKARVALEAAKDLKTLNELGSQFNVHPAQISQWKSALLAGIRTIFSNPKKNVDMTQKIDELHRLIGEVTVERDWLKKKVPL
jgi:transposase-like protein